MGNSLQGHGAFISARGELAAALSIRGYAPRLFLPAKLEEITTWWEVQRSCQGSYYQCSRCDQDVLIRRLHPQRFVVARRRFSSHEKECPNGRASSERCVVSLNDIDSLFGGGKIDGEKITLRLRNRLNRASARTLRLLAENLSPDERKLGRKRKSAYSLLGYLQLLTECAGLNCFWDDREYAMGFPTVVAYLHRHFRDIVRQGMLGSLGDKTFFPEAEVDFTDTMDGAFNTECPDLRLKGKALVVGRLYSVAEEPAKTKLMLTGMGGARLSIESGLWRSLCRSFEYPKLPAPNRDHTVESLFIALLSRDVDELHVAEAAWCRIDRHGIASASDYEHETIGQLVRHRYRFYKPLHQSIAVGPWAMLVDFLVLSAGGWTVLEVDPNGSSKFKPSKRRRIERCRQAGVPQTSFDPVAHSDIRLVLPQHGSQFSPLGPVTSTTDKQQLEHRLISRRL